MNKKSISILIGLIVTIALGICFYYTPHWSVSNMKKAAENRQAGLPGHDIGYTAHEIEELAAKISEKGRQAELSEGKILKIIEKIVIVYKLEMIQAGDTPKEKLAVMEKINNMIDSEINAVKTQVERERELVEVGNKEGEILLQNQRNALIDTETGTSKKQLEEKRKFIKKQIELEIEHLVKIKERQAASEKYYKEQIEKIDTVQAMAEDLIKRTAESIVKLERSR